MSWEERLSSLDAPAGAPAGADDARVLAEPEPDEDTLQCALVEYVLGNVQTRKWTLVLGQTYKIGKKETGSDIEIDHESISRRHCSLALTMVEDELMLVVLDPGSSNGTFVDKCKLEKGVGLTKKLKDFRFMMFGHCENGYRILTRGKAGESSAKGAHYGADRSKRGGPGEARAVNKRGGPLSAEQKAQVARLSRLVGTAVVDDGGAGDSTEAPAERKERAAASKRVEPAAASANASGNRKERREAARQKDGQGGARSRSRSRSPAAKKADEWQQKAEKAKLMEVARRQQREEQKKREQSDLKELRGGASSAAGSSRRPELGGSKDKSKSSWKTDPDAYLSRKQKEGEGSKAAGPAGKSDIEWPEEWK